MDNQELQHIVDQFALDGPVAQIKPLGAGFINDTFKVDTVGEHADYILQRKNKTIFPDVPAMMNNIEMVTEHIRRKVIAAGGDPLREVLTVTKTKDGKLCYEDKEGQFWAMCVFIGGSVTYERADSPELCYKGGQGIGKFQSQLADFTQPLAEIIKGFHNIRWRFTQWDESLKADKAGRVKDLAKEIEWVNSRREEMLSFWSRVETGEIPMRVTHNDTKISNILFDKQGEVLCVIDLDTVMSSTSLNDFGDAIRSYTNTGAEDDKDLSKVSMSIDMFRAYTEGYLHERKSTLTDSEREWLAFSARYITYEQVLRFLMDYIDGDTYYKVAYPEHNLVRTHAQYKLLSSMEEQYKAMCDIVKRNA
jgi:Ser/Thr protein kinase RdoA (MazF antagonist)